MFFLKLELIFLNRIPLTAVGKLPCYTLANFNNLIHSVTSLICHLCFLYICCYLITNIFIFYRQYLPPLGVMVSVMIQASADGITAHYRAEGDWDLGAQWGVTPSSRAGWRREATRYKWQCSSNDILSLGVSNDE